MKDKEVQKNKISTTKKIVGTAVFSALAFAISYLEFPIFPAVPFLKLDFSQVFIMLTGFIYGPIYGICACVIKEALCLAKSSTIIGELANVVITSGFILLPTIVYQYKKGLKLVIVTLICGVLIHTALALIMNKFVLFPLYMLSDDFFNSVWYFILLFNLIKATVNSALTILLYKRVKILFEKI